MPNSTAKLIASARKAAGLTQEDLAGILGIKQESLARAESDKYNPSVEFLERIAKALGKELVIMLK